MITDTHFKILSEEQMQWVQFRAQNIFQELKDEEQWNSFCRHKTHDFVEATAIKSDAAVQAKPVQTVPKTILHSKTLRKEQKLSTVVQQAKTNYVRIDPSTKDLHVIIEKLENLQSSVLELKSSQSQGTKKESSNDQISTFPSVSSVAQQHENVCQVDLIHRAIASTFAKCEENVICKIKNARPKGIGFLLPYCLREERMLAKRALDRSMIVKPVLKSTDDQKMLSKKQVQFSTVRSGEQTKGKQKSMSKIKTSLTVKKGKPLKTAGRDLKDQSVEKIAKQSTDSVDKFIPCAEETKQRNVNSITLLEKRMNEIEHIENTVRQRINNLKPSSSTTNITLVSSQNNENVKQTELLNFDNLYPEVGTSRMNVKEVHNKSPTVELPNDNTANFTTVKPKIALDSELLANRSSTVDTGRTELAIKPSTLKSIHHHRKLYGQYLHRTAHQKVGNFNPWTVASQMSDLILDDCIEEVAQELNKIPSSFVVDIYNQEFTQSLL